MTVLRLAAHPLIGADISFTAFFPVVILAALAGGAAGGLATIGAGSIVALAFSSGPESGLQPDALPRLSVWLISSLAVAAVALGLRHAMMALSAHKAQLQAAADRLQLVVGELEHRGKNALAMVEALSRDTARQADSVEDYQRALSSQIHALAASYAFLIKRRPEPVLLGSLVDEVLNVFRAQIDIEGGPPVWVSPDDAVIMALALHELSTNAAKYGALSTPQGQVIIGWSLDGEARLKLVWAERFGPRPSRASPRGFGSRLIKRAFEQLPRGSITMNFQPPGLVCTLSAQTRAHTSSLGSVTDRQRDPCGPHAIPAKSRTSAGRKAGEASA